MRHAASDDPWLRELEEDIYAAESLVGRLAALAAISSAAGRAGQAREARQLLRAAAGLLAGLHALRQRPRTDPDRRA